MSMRYILRKPNPVDYSDVRSEVKNLTELLGTPDESTRRDIRVTVNPMRRITYQFQTEKKGEAWTWVCSTIELVGETEKDLLALTDKFQVPRQNLSHFLPA